AGFESFVGQYPIPMRHGMTVGELAQLFNERFRLGATLEVVQMEGWRREQYWDETGAPWVMPSPNIPTLDSAIVYPGTVLFEGTMLSEGRGTTRPFEVVGAPWIDADAFAERMNRLALPGAHFRPATFEPTFQKHAKTPCGGCQIHVTDRKVFAPVAVGAALLREFHGTAPKQFAWRQPPYEYEHDKLPIEILAGSSALREQVDSQAPLSEIVASWKPGEDGFRELRSRFVLYESRLKPRPTYARPRVRTSLRTDGPGLARAADLISVTVRVLRVDIQPDQDAVVARLRVRPPAGPLGLAQTLEQLPCRLARGGKGAHRRLDRPGVVESSGELFLVVADDHRLVLGDEAAKPNRGRHLAVGEVMHDLARRPLV